MPRDEVAADQLASAHLNGTHHRAAFSATALCRMRRSAALG
jgi:hypothetical protein